MRMCILKMSFLKLDSTYANSLSTFCWNTSFFFHIREMLISGWAVYLKTLLCLSTFNTLFPKVHYMICASICGSQTPFLIRTEGFCFVIFAFFLNLVMNWLWSPVSHGIISRVHKWSWLGYLGNPDNQSKQGLWVMVGETGGDVRDSLLYIQEISISWS